MRSYRIQQNAVLAMGLGMQFPIARNRTFGAKCFLVHVVHGMPMGVHLRSGFEPLHGGFETDNGDIVSDLENDTLVLLGPADKLTLFGFDGSVQMIKNIDGECEHGSLLLEDALNLRLDRIVEKLEEAALDESLGADRRAKWQDALLHEVALMLKLSTDRPLQRRHILLFAERVMSKLVIRPGVRKHFEEVLSEQRDPTFYGWLAGKVEDDDESIIDFAAERERRGAPASALRRKQARANADREARKTMKGSGEEKPLHQAGNKKGDGKKKVTTGK